MPTVLGISVDVSVCVARGVRLCVFRALIMQAQLSASRFSVVRQHILNGCDLRSHSSVMRASCRHPMATSSRRLAPSNRISSATFSGQRDPNPGNHQCVVWLSRSCYHRVPTTCCLSLAVAALCRRLSLTVQCMTSPDNVRARCSLLHCDRVLLNHRHVRKPQFQLTPFSSLMLFSGHVIWRTRRSVV
jgi:hypothetical protein